jgi:hypothetical protein
MKVENTLNDYIISLPKNIFGLKYVDKRLADLRIIEISAKLKGSEEDVNELATTIDSEWWDLNKAKFSK